MADGRHFEKKLKVLRNRVSYRSKILYGDAWCHITYING